MRYVGYVACTGLCMDFVRETQKERHSLEDPGTEGWIILKRIFKKQDGGHLIGLIRTGTCGRLLQTQCAFGFGKIWGVCWLDKELLPSQEGIYSMQLSCQSVGHLS